MQRVTDVEAASNAHSLSLISGLWPVVIVGGGPTGLTLSALLSKFGVPSILIEKSKALTNHPQVTLFVFESMAF